MKCTDMRHLSNTEATALPLNTTPLGMIALTSFSVGSTSRIILRTATATELPIVFLVLVVMLVSRLYSTMNQAEPSINMSLPPTMNPSLSSGAATISEMVNPTVGHTSLGLNIIKISHSISFFAEDAWVLSKVPHPDPEEFEQVVGEAIDEYLDRDQLRGTVQVRSLILNKF